MPAYNQLGRSDSFNLLGYSTLVCALLTSRRKKPTEKPSRDSDASRLKLGLSRDTNIFITLQIHSIAVFV